MSRNENFKCSGCTGSHAGCILEPFDPQRLPIIASKKVRQGSKDFCYPFLNLEVSNMAGLRDEIVG